MSTYKKLKKLNEQEKFKVNNTEVKKESAKTNSSITEENMTFMEEIPTVEVQNTFYKSMLQNQFLHHLRNKNVYIAIQTITNEVYIGTLISFDEYTLHVYVEDKKFNSAMLFFKSGLTYIRVLTEAAYQYYVNNSNKKKEFAKQRGSDKSYIPAKVKDSYNKDQSHKNSLKESSNKGSINIADTLATKFKVTNNNKRTNF